MQYKALVFDLFGILVEFGPENIPQVIPEGAQFFNHCRTLLETSDIQFYVLSNARKDTITFLQKKYPYIFDHFVGITTSEHAGVKKPAIEIFHHFLQQHNLSADNCIFIDDTLANIIAAQTLGFSVIHYQNPSGSLHALKKLMKLV